MIQEQIEKENRRIEYTYRVGLWDKSGVELRHRQQKFGDLLNHARWASALKRAGKIVASGGMAVLLGGRGNGKTQCGVELIRNEVMRAKVGESRTFRYIRSREIGMALREAYNGVNITERQSIGVFVKPHPLVIDEAQERGDKDWEIRSLTLILDKRYGAMKPTVLIANCTPQQFTKLMGGSVTDRIKEGGEIILFDWPSFRKEKP